MLVIIIVVKIIFIYFYNVYRIRKTFMIRVKISGVVQFFKIVLSQYVVLVHIIYIHLYTMSGYIDYKWPTPNSWERYVIEGEEV